VDSWINKKTLAISEFKILDDKGRMLVEYGAVQDCIVKVLKKSVMITEVVHLPVPRTSKKEKEWSWKDIPVEKRIIYLKRGEIVVSKEQLVLKPPTRSKKVLKELEKEIKKYHILGLKHFYEQDKDPYKDIRKR